MAVGQMVLQFDNAVVSEESGKKGVVKLVLDLVPADNTPQIEAKATLLYPAAPFALTTEAPVDFDKRYVLTISEWVE